MSTATLPRIVSGQSDLLRDELQDELRHIRDLVFIRDLLRERGGTSIELWEYDAVINNARAQLGESGSRPGARRTHRRETSASPNRLAMVPTHSKDVPTHKMALAAGPRAAVGAVERVEDSHVAVGEFEVEQLGVGADAFLAA